MIKYRASYQVIRVDKVEIKGNYFRYVDREDKREGFIYHYEETNTIKFVDSPLVAAVGLYGYINDRYETTKKELESINTKLKLSIDLVKEMSDKDQAIKNNSLLDKPDK